MRAVAGLFAFFVGLGGVANVWLFGYGVVAYGHWDWKVLMNIGICAVIVVALGAFAVSGKKQATSTQSSSYGDFCLRCGNKRYVSSTLGGGSAGQALTTQRPCPKCSGGLY